MIITIDGPVASGKSSVAKALAKELNIYYLYTGMLYRAVAYVLLRKLEKEKGRVVSNEEIIQHMQKVTPEKFAFMKDIAYDYGEDLVYLFHGNENITEYLKDVRLDQVASIVSAHKQVRDLLLDVQRDVAKKYDIVADGRDCGSIVFPDADHKFFLTAEVEVRAQRLMLDETRGGVAQDLEKVKAGVEERDQRDRERAVAPLVIPQDATIIDSSKLTLQETVDKFLRIIKGSL